jgi:type IV fimbrial biogenesis protein FimT
LRQTGFTIAELMMSLALLAVGAALSIPSYREMVEKRQLTHGAEQIMAFVNTAQSEAGKRNRIVTVSFHRDASDDWCVGAVLGATACDCMETNTAASDYCAIDGAPRIINNTHAGNTDLVTDMKGQDGKYSVEPVRGILTNPDDYLIVEMRSNSQDYRLDLQVNNTGQAILCSHDDSHEVPGYGTCS